MLFRAVTVALLAVLLATAGRARAEDREQIIAMFYVTPGGKGLILLPVTIGRVKSQFVVDTGSAMSAVDIELRQLVRPTDRKLLVREHGEREIVIVRDGVVGTPQLRLDGQAICADLAPIREGNGCKNVRGILGMNFLKAYVVRFDFAAGTLTFLRSAPAASGRAFDLAYEAGCPVLDAEIAGETKLPFTVDTGHDGSEAGLAPNAFADLVDRGSLTLSEVESRVATLSGIRTERQGSLRRFRLGQFEHSDIEVSESSCNTLNLPYLSRFRVTFDFPRDRVFFEERKQSIGRVDSLGPRNSR